MSHQQPGPYGGQPQQPGPYGRPGPYNQPGPYSRPGPYGQPPQAPQPGYGYPQQAPPPVPPGSGHPQQPGPGVPPPPYPYGQQPPYGQSPYGTPPQAPGGGGGGRKAAVIVGAVAVAAAIGVGTYLVIGDGGSGGLRDDGPHRLSAPQTLLGEYTRVGEGDKDLSSGAAEELAKGGVRNGKSLAASYSTADFGDFDPLDPSTVPDRSELLTAKGVSFTGAYGEVADPEATLDKLFDSLKKEADKHKQSGSNGLMSELLGEPESVPIDGAVMKCQAAKGRNNLTHKESTNWFCAWADYSTFALVSPGDNTKDISKSAASEITTQVRDEIRVEDRDRTGTRRGN